jgi:DnaK suppressor protein
LPSKKKPVKKPVKKAVTPAKKPATKKAAAKPAPKAKNPVAVKAKPVVKKPVAKKPVAKKAPVKAVAKKTVAKAAPKKVIAKKPAPKAVAKKVVAKSTPKKAVSPVLKSVPKKPLAPLGKTAVKASPAREITPIKAPTLVSVPKPRPKDSKTDMTQTILPVNYEPTDTEEFMSPVMKEYFRQRLFTWRDELLRESEETLHTLHEEGNMQKPDITDRASEETDLAIEFRTRDRERKLLNKIIEAISRIDDGSYGYCEETGDPIPVKRLIARPTAVRTLEAEELHERRERTQRDQYE